MKINDSRKGNRKWRVLQPRRKTSCRGDAYWSFQISDGQRLHLALAWIGEYQGPEELVHGQEAHITGEWVTSHGRRLLRCRIIAPTQAAPLAYERARIRGRAIFLRMPEGELKQFMYRVFQSPVTKEVFFDSPASWHHHHAYRHGLFIHSVDAAWRIYRDPSLHGMEKWVAVAAALLHDFGKVPLFSDQAEQARSATYIDHEVLGLAILDEELRWLEDHAPDIHRMLRHYLTWRPREGFPRSFGAAHVRLADQASAASEIRRRSVIR